MDNATRIALFRYLFAAALVAAIMCLLLFGRPGDSNVTVLVAILGGVVSALFTGQALQETHSQTQTQIQKDVKDIANGVAAEAYAQGKQDQKDTQGH